MHFSAAFPDHAQNEGMRYGRLDVQTLVVQRFEFLVVLLRRVHLNLEGVDLQELSALLEVVLALVRLAGRMQLFQNPVYGGQYACM